MTNMYSYTIDQVKFESIPDSCTPEKLASRFGLLVPVQEETIGYIDVEGPIMVTTNHVKGMKFMHQMPLIYLDDHEKLKCTLILKKDCGKTHSKWNPVSAVKFKEHPEGFLFQFELIGLLTMDEIIKQLNI